LGTLDGGGRVPRRARTARLGRATVRLIRGLREGQNATRRAVPSKIQPEPGNVRGFRSASVRFCFGSELAIQSGASSVGPSEHFWRLRHRLSVAEGAGMATKPAGLIGTSRPGNRFCRVRNYPRIGVTLGRMPLGPRTATSCQPRAALAGEGSEKDAGILDIEGSGAAPRG